MLKKKISKLKSQFENRLSDFIKFETFAEQLNKKQSEQSQMCQKQILSGISGFAAKLEELQLAFRGSSSVKRDLDAQINLLREHFTQKIGELSTDNKELKIFKTEIKDYIDKKLAPQIK